ncbi:MAG: hypothetical protein UH241_10270 [Acutalibacteraceae bacterium]|nr:hypothetical protein [Acutalibacteraceae bacterium]
MKDFDLIIDKLMSLYQLSFTVFGYKLNLLTVFIGTSLIALAVYGVRRMFL